MHFRCLGGEKESLDRVPGVRARLLDLRSYGNKVWGGNRADKGNRRLGGGRVRRRERVSFTVGKRQGEVVRRAQSLFRGVPSKGQAMENLSNS